jgi:hypothetical protein
LSIHTRLERFGFSYSVFTNAQTLFDSKAGRKVATTEASLTPHFGNLPIFKLAHEKIEIFRKIGALCNSCRYTYLDLDVIPISPKNSEMGADSYLQFLMLPYSGSDVSRFFQGKTDSSDWAGGEYLSGTAASFSWLSNQIDKVLPDYLDSIGEFEHVGDESLVNLAIWGSAAGLLGETESPEIVATERISSLWTLSTLDPMEPLSRSIESDFLHLPSDKEFVAWMRHLSGMHPSTTRFAIFSYVALKQLPVRIIGFIRNLKSGNGRSFYPKIFHRGD